MRAALTALAVVFAAPAFAGGVAPVTPLPPVMIEPEQTWDGWYGGLQLTYGQGEIDTPPAADIEGNLYGIFLGYRYDMGDFVLGGELDYEHGSVALDAPGDTEVDWIFRSAVELGYDAGNLLPYATVGVATAHFTDPTPPAGFDATSLGYFAGVGLDYAISERFTVGAEVLFHQFDEGPSATSSTSLQTLSVNAAFRF
ncbi:outer membrane protein [Hasllibacter sp. MH4015]|uniref:outer membrane protein n=1 Tax=Hasllibacter sp. MH4015 TaxID=2854029 RepID=UPI001CD1DB5C|nr:outer membrane beta-barrel protein [Hasllibacter sp. MH4015]